MDQTEAASLWGKSRCHRSSVSGGTKNRPRRLRSSNRLSPTNRARSGGLEAGRIPGDGVEPPRDGAWPPRRPDYRCQVDWGALTGGFWRRRGI